MELGILGGVFDSSGPLSGTTNIQVITLPVPMNPVLQSVFTLKDRLLILSNNSSGTSGTSACKRTIVTYDGELIENSGDEDYPGNSYQRHVTVHGESASNDYAYCLLNYAYTNEYLYKYDVQAHTFTRIGALPTNTSPGYFGGLANTYIQLNGKIYWFGTYTVSGVKEIRVELLDPNTAVATRMATANVYNDLTIPSSSYNNMICSGTDGKDTLYLFMPQNGSVCESQIWSYNVNTRELKLFSRYQIESRVSAFGEYGAIYIKDDMIYYIPNNIRPYVQGGTIKYSKLGADKWIEIKGLAHRSEGAMNVTCYSGGVIMTRAGDFNPMLLNLNY